MFLCKESGSSPSGNSATLMFIPSAEAYQCFKTRLILRITVKMVTFSVRRLMSLICSVVERFQNWQPFSIPLWWSEMMSITFYQKTQVFFEMACLLFDLNHIKRWIYGKFLFRRIEIFRCFTLDFRISAPKPKTLPEKL